MGTPIDFGAHQRMNSSGLVHASNTMRTGPLKVRVTTSSRSDFRSIVVRLFMGSLSVFCPSTFSFRFNSSTILSNASKRASQSWR